MASFVSSVTELMEQEETDTVVSFVTSAHESLWANVNGGAVFINMQQHMQPFNRTVTN